MLERPGQKSSDIIPKGGAAAGKPPVNPNDFEDDPYEFEVKLAEDVNNLVTVANTHKCRSTCQTLGS